MSRIHNTAYRYKPFVPPANCSGGEVLAGSGGGRGGEDRFCSRHCHQFQQAGELDPLKYLTLLANKAVYFQPIAFYLFLGDRQLRCIKPRVSISSNDSHLSALLLNQDPGAVNWKTRIFQKFSTNEHSFKLIENMTRPSQEQKIYCYKHLAKIDIENIEQSGNLKVCKEGNRSSMACLTNFLFLATKSVSQLSSARTAAWG
jgi:hypothetical protein